MKTTTKIRKVLLVITLTLTFGLTGCSTNDKENENSETNTTVELQPNELSVEETKVLKAGDTVPKGKEVNRELLEQQGMDSLYVYHTYKMSNGELVGNSERDIYTYNELPSQEEKIVAGESIIAYYEFLRKEIVNVEFVKMEDGTYKKRAIPEGYQFALKLIAVIDENNIDKDKVKTLK